MTLFHSKCRQRAASALLPSSDRQSEGLSDGHERGDESSADTGSG